MGNRARLVTGALVALGAGRSRSSGRVRERRAGPVAGGSSDRGRVGRWVAWPRTPRAAWSSTGTRAAPSCSPAFVPATGSTTRPSRKSTGVTDAARAHLDRYGASFGADRSGTTLVETRAVHTVSGQDVVRFAQRVDGLPVIGGEMVVSLRADRELGSMLATLSSATSVAAPAVTRRAAARSARAAARQGDRVSRVRLPGLVCRVAGSSTPPSSARPRRSARAPSGASTSPVARVNAVSC